MRAELIETSAWLVAGIVVADVVIERMSVIGELRSPVAARNVAQAAFPAEEEPVGAGTGGHTLAQAPAQVDAEVLSFSNRYMARPVPSTRAVPGRGGAADRHDRRRWSLGGWRPPGSSRLLGRPSRGRYSRRQRP